MTSKVKPYRTEAKSRPNHQPIMQEESSSDEDFSIASLPDKSGSIATVPYAQSLLSPDSLGSGLESDDKFFIPEPLNPHINREQNEQDKEIDAL